MDALPLAYTPHPAMRTAATPKYVSPEVRRSESSQGLAVGAAAGLVLLGSACLLASPSSSPEIAPIEVTARPFASRETAALRPVEAPAPVEARSASPLPFAGDALGPEPEPVAAPVAAAPRVRHVLTSFDGSREMSNGVSDPGVARNAVAAAASAPRRFAPAPVVWNRPLNWVSTHKQGL